MASPSVTSALSYDHEAPFLHHGMDIFAYDDLAKRVILPKG